MDPEEKKRRKELVQRYRQQEAMQSPIYQRRKKFLDQLVFDPDVIRETDGNDLEIRLVLGIIYQMEEHVNQDRYNDESSGLYRLPPGPRAVYCTWVLESGFSKGGFTGFLYCQSSSLVNCALEGYTFLNLPRTRELLEKANALYKRGETTNRLNSAMYRHIALSKERKISMIWQHPEQFVFRPWDLL